MTILSQSTPSILPLHSSEAGLSLVGGKGANLAKLANAGFPVPDGFLVTTAAYHEFVESNQLAAWIGSTLAQTQLDDPDSLEQASKAIRTRFVEGSVPTFLADQLRQAYRQLGQPPVAVRSSATAEDLPEMSFAGQQDTYLNILGEAELLRAVVNCWGSLWTARAIGYRSRNGIDHTAVALSVVVQEMVQSEASGVLFTVNPLTGKRSETVIDATLGLGEALVSGQVEPDHYVIDRLTSQIIGKTLGAKALAIHGDAAGGTKTVHSDSSQRQALPDAAILDLAALGEKVAAFYDSPQDIEWGWANNRLYLLQARPVTSLFPVPQLVGKSDKSDGADNGKGLDIFVSFGAIQGVLDPITPLGHDTFASLLCGMSTVFGYTYTLDSQQTIWRAGEREWVRITPAITNTAGRKVIRAALGIIEPSVRQALDPLLNEAALQQTGQPTFDTIRHLAHFGRARAAGIARSLWHPERERADLQNKIESALNRVELQVKSTSTLAARIACYERVMTNEIAKIMPEILNRVPAGLMMLNRVITIANETWQGDATKSKKVLELTRGLPHNVTTEMDLSLWEVAKSIRQDDAALTYMQQQDAKTLAHQYLTQQLPATAQKSIANFLDRYGMRGIAEIDIGRQRWREEPMQVMQMVQSYLRIDDPAQAPDAVFKRGEERAEAVLNELVSDLRQAGQIGAFKASVVQQFARRMRALAGLRETPKFFVIRLLGILRPAFLQSGAALVEQGILAEANDLFFLHLSELKRLAAGEANDWKALVAERRARYEREKLRRQIPRLLLSDGRAFYDGIRSNQAESDKLLIGTPVSPGTVEGTVHVVFEPHNAQLAPGEILVCPGTDPAWTPLFLAAGGLVMEVGGLMTHGSVVAREYGIPAVVGVHEATARLKTGQRIRVDGTSGEIELL